MFRNIYILNVSNIYLTKEGVIMANSLVIYFSRSGENYFGGELKNIEKGNTEVVENVSNIRRFIETNLVK